MAVLVRRRADIVETELDDETVVMRLDDGRFFSLRGSAREIWRLIPDGADRAALVRDLARRYDAPPERIAADVDAFLASLADAGLVERG